MYKNFSGEYGKKQRPALNSKTTGGQLSFIFVHLSTLHKKGKSGCYRNFKGHFFDFFFSNLNNGKK